MSIDSKTEIDTDYCPMNDEKKTLQKTRYSIQISEHLADKVDKHLRVLKFLGRKKESQKQQWVTEAIIKKLHKEENIPPYDLPKGKHLGLDLDHELRDRIERVVDTVKKMRRTYSKKQWILEAIAEQLDLEEDIIEKEIKEQVDSK